MATLAGGLFDILGNTGLGEGLIAPLASIYFAHMSREAALTGARSRSPAITSAWIAFSEQLTRTSIHMIRESEANQQPESAVPTRIGKMQDELRLALTNTSNEDMAKLAVFFAKDFTNAVGRRVVSIASLAVSLHKGVLSESQMLVQAFMKDSTIDHISQRLSLGKDKVAASVASGATALYALYKELNDDPKGTIPRLFVLVMASLLAAGGVDGDGGVPDLDIPLMGIGEHRSLFTHSILIGSLLETALMLITRVIVSVHKNLPKTHDPLWDDMLKHSEELLNTAKSGISIGIAYHLLVDAFIQPAPYHGLPVHVPIEVHQTIMAVNAAGEASAVCVRRSAT